MGQRQRRVAGEKLGVNALQQNTYLGLGVAGNECFAGADEVAPLEQPGGLLRGEYQQLIATGCYQLVKQRLGVAFIERGQRRVVFGVARSLLGLAVRVEDAEAPGGDKLDVEGDDLLLEQEEVEDEEEVGVGGGGLFGYGRRGGEEGQGGLVDDLVGEVVEDGGLVLHIHQSS